MSSSVSVSPTSSSAPSPSSLSSPALLSTQTDVSAKQQRPAPGSDLRSKDREEVQQRLLTLLTKAFLHVWYLSFPSHQSSQSGNDDGESAHYLLWTRVLEYLEIISALQPARAPTAVDSKQGKEEEGGRMFVEAVTEHVKNMLLVMSSSGVWQNGRGRVSAKQWRLSLAGIPRFCPSLSTILHTFTEGL